MAQQEKQLTEKESLELIATMINKAKSSYHNTGLGAIMWGSVIAVCSLARLAEIQFNFNLPFDIYLLTLVAIIPQIFITIKEKKERKVKSYDDDFMSYLWLAFGICIFLMVFITNNIFAALDPVVKGYKEFAVQTGNHSNFQFSEYISSLFLLVYGFPTFVTGATLKFKPMLWGGILCWVCCIVSIYTSIKTDLLLTGLSAVFAWLIPGIIMERDYKKAKQGLMESNV